MTIASVNRPAQAPAPLVPSRGSGPFVSGAVVLVTLNAPREKFWGAILEITAAGLSARGINLESFDDFVGQVREGEPVSPGAVFFPMHRIERIEIDARNGEIPSLCERFFKNTGCLAADVLGGDMAAASGLGGTLREAERRLALATLASCQGDYEEAARVLDISPEHLQRLLQAAASQRDGA